MGTCRKCNGYGYVYKGVPYHPGMKGEQITCTACGGSGSDNTCDICHGYGYVYEGVAYYSGARGQQITCPTCGGSGRKS